MTKIEKVTDWLSIDKPNIVMIGTHDGTSEYFLSLKDAISEKIATHKHPVHCVATSFTPKHLDSVNKKKLHKGDLDSLLEKARKQNEKFVVVLVGENVPDQVGQAMHHTERLLRYHKTDRMKLLISMDPQFSGRKLFEQRHNHLSSMIGLYEDHESLSHTVMQLSLMSAYNYDNHVRIEISDQSGGKYMPGVGVVQSPKKV